MRKRCKLFFPVTSSFFVHFSLWTHLVHYSVVCVVDFEQVNVEWDLSGSFEQLESWKNLENSHAFSFERLSRTQVFQQRLLDCTQIKTICHTNIHTARIWYLLWLLYMADITVWYTVKTCFAKLRNKSFSSCSFSCLMIKVSEPEVLC